MTEDRAGESMRGSELPRTGLEIAVIGMAGRFPGARDVAAFWRNLRDGVESISFFAEEELLAAGVPRERLADPLFVPAGGVLDEADRFDAAFFGYNPREAELMDPQQRIFLECAWEALEDAGYDSLRTPGAVGVYGGVAMGSYVLNVFSRPDLVAAVGAQQASIGNDKDYLCTRVSYKLGLEGPSLAVQTACSTSLVAVHLASQALVGGECDMALAGGVAVSFPQKTGYLYSPSGILSPDGHCRAFDVNARGAVGGQGVGIVVLKRLESALADGDSIRAVILGSAVTNDGAAKAGFTAPRVDGQAKAIRAAHLAAEVEPATITFVETHGTATELGDPIEVAALTQAFRAGTDRRGFCSLGAVKTNVGHLDIASGVTGLIKTVLALQHRELPPSLHFETPHPELRLDESPFYVQTRLAPWPAGEAPRRAGVSSFGVGGTNVHVVLEEAPAAAPARPGRPWQLLPLSARSAATLDSATERLREHLRRCEEPLADVAYTLQVGRREFDHRRTVVCRDLEEAVRLLEEKDRLPSCTAGRNRPPVAFLFPGVGDHYPGMGQGLYESEPIFRAVIDECAGLLRPELGMDLREALYPETGAPGREGGLDLRRMLRPDGAAAGPLHRTALAQPALFAVEIALARLWMSWGIQPRALLGYSLGEYAAACLAGVLTLESALTLVARRARLIDRLPEGAMLSVPLAEEEVRPRLGDGLWISAVNGRALSVVAGTPEAVAGLAASLEAEGIVSLPVRTSHAFHSGMMQPAAAELRRLVRSLDLRPPGIPYLSNVTGTWIRGSEATDPEYWVEHMLRPVRLADGLAQLGKEPGWLLLEVGPGRSLGSLAVQQLPGAAAVLPALRHDSENREDRELLLDSLGRLWMAGAEVGWSGVHGGEARRRVPLPTYPFERQRFWIERAAERTSGTARTTRTDGRLDDPAEWFHVPGWRLAARPRAAGELEGAWLVLADGRGLGGRLAARLRGAGCAVVEVVPGEGFARLGEGRYSVDPRRVEDYAAVLAEQVPRRILHLWSLASEESPTLGCHSLVLLAQAVHRLGLSENAVEICAIADGLCRVERGDRLDPVKAALLGPIRVIPWEHPEISCRAIDVDAREIGGGLAGRLLAEILAAEPEPLTALRGGERWVATLDPVRLEPAGGPAPLREGGVYLITGEPGSTGLALARHLGSALQAKVAVQETLAHVRDRWGRIDGVFHLTAAEPDLVRMADPARLAESLAPALDAAEVLEALRETADPPDFLVLLSSLATVTGGFGQLANAAAGAFLDAFARSRRGETGPAVVVVHGPEWHWEKGEQGEAQAQGVSLDEGMEALGRVLASGLSQVVVSARDLRAVAAERSALLQRLAGPARPAGGRREALGIPYVAPGDAVEQTLADLWQELLGVPQAGVHDDFFQLGGHSLIGLQVLARLREAFTVELPLRILFEAPTIAALAAVIRDRAGRPEAALVPAVAAAGLDAEELLERVDELSEDEMDALLAQMGAGEEDLE
jgi:acyl transferase domain-containing protein